MLQNIIVIAKHGESYVKQCVNSLPKDCPYVVIDTGTQHPTGAYLAAYRQVNARNYLFIQDSMENLSDDPIKPFKELMPSLGAVAWCSFPFVYDNNNQRDYVERQYSDTPSRGIFGPIFYTSRKSLEILEEKGLLPIVPNNRNEAQGTERGWACAYHMADMPVEYMYGWSPEAIKNGTLLPFKKVFANRK